MSAFDDLDEAKWANGNLIWEIGLSIVEEDKHIAVVRMENG